MSVKNHSQEDPPRQVLEAGVRAGFQGVADSYERGRPGYPEQAIRYLIRALKAGPNSTIVDLGAGTGKFSRLLLPTGARIIAVEPVEGMRHKLKTYSPGIEVLAGMAEAIPLPSATAHSIVCAQAFHWFKGNLALPEIHRVLKPHGRLGLIWNVKDESTRWVEQLTKIINQYEGETPRYKSGGWKQAFNDSRLFSIFQHKQFIFVQKGTVETILDRVASISFISVLPEPSRLKALKDVTDLLNAHPMTSGQTILELPHRTDVYCCSRM